jgi:aminopeptidase N
MLSSITTKQRNGALLGIGTVAALGAGLYYLSKNSPKPDAKPRVRNTTNLGLSQAIAEERRANLQGDVAHEVYLLYLDGKKKYRGCIRLTFHSSGEGELYLDFTGKVLRLQVNNETIDDSLVNGSAGLHDGALLRLPRDFIVEGKNLVTIDFECTPSNDCSGHTLTNNPHQLKGSDEKYYYGWNECYGQKNMIPNFEQPDVRGTYKLFVCAPMTWAVTSNEKKCGFHDALDLHFIKMGGKEDHSHEHLESHAGDDHQFLQACHNRLFVIPPGQTHTDYTVREFHNTEPFPSYLFCVYAGHMEMCTSSIMHRDLKFRIFAPSYQAGPLQRCADLWANMHMYGLKFYEQLLGVEYPYSKYDATLTPHMSITFGACEYPGNVIFQEPCLEHNYGNFVYTRVFLIILHEMAHMWFGNLVSLRWWDDLWLKEGFADLCTHYAMIAFQKEMPEWVPAFGPAGHRFKGSQWVPTEVTFSVRKTGGMIEDITPHFRRGLKTDCKLSQDQIALYNRVTYGKSYAVLHEMFNLLGGEDFFGKWSKFYLTKYANKATDFEDFTGSLIQALTAKGVSPEMVRTVTHDHIKMPGADTLEFEIDFAENLITIYQHPFTPGHYRHHYFDIALFGQDGKFLELLTVNMPNVQNFQVSFEESSVNFEILPNYSNFGYFFQDLDEGQRSFFELNSNNLDCKALSMVNQCLYLDVLQGKLLIDQYLGTFPIFSKQNRLRR